MKRRDYYIGLGLVVFAILVGALINRPATQYVTPPVSRAEVMEFAKQAEVMMDKQTKLKRLEIEAAANKK